MDKKEKLYNYIIDEVVNDTELYWGGNKPCFRVGYYLSKEFGFFCVPYFIEKDEHNHNALKEHFQSHISNRYGSSEEEALMLWDRYVDVICDRIRTMEYKRLPRPMKFVLDNNTSSSTTIF